MLSLILRRVYPLFMLLFAITLLQGCNQGNSSGSGRVSVLVTDGPTTQFDQVNITVDSIQLLGEGPGVYLTNQPMTFNLLDLRNVSTMLGVNDQVPVGTYSKLRMDVSKVELVKLNTDGSVAETNIAELPSGHIDLNPQSQITVAPGGDLVMELDINAENSLQVTATGNGKYIFRPQVFVSVLSDASTSLVRLSGTALDITADTFELCEKGATQVSPDCKQVNVSTATTVMNASMDVTAYASMQAGDPVVVFGRLDGSVDAINAIQIFDGTTELSMFRGTFSGPVTADSADIVISQTSPGVSVGDSLQVTPFSSASVLDRQGNVLSVDAIATGVTAQVVGVLTPDATTPTAIKPGLVIVESP